MKPYKLLIVLFIVSVNISFTTSIVEAQNGNGNGQDKRDEKLLEKTENRCERVKNKINSKLEKYRSSRDKHVDRYTKISEKLQTLTNRLKNSGYDVVKLQEYINELNLLIAEFKENNEQTLQELTNSGERACVEDRSGFDTSLLNAREKLRTVREGAKNIKNFIIETIKPELERVKNQLISENN